MTIESVTNIDYSKDNAVNKTSSGSGFSDSINTTYTYSDIFNKASEKYNIPVEFLKAVAEAESDFDSDCVSSCGAMGIMQLMPATAKNLGVDNAFDPVENIMGGAKYLSGLIKQYKGNTDLALAAYNGGSGNVRKYGGVPPFCEKYVNKINRRTNEGVKIPNKTVTVSKASSAGALMTGTVSTARAYIDDSVESTKETVNSSTKNYSSEDIDSLLKQIYENEKNMTYTVKLELLESLLKDSEEYEHALKIINNAQLLKLGDNSSNTDDYSYN